ncbi:uncharacterized protein LOC115629599 [Scaptodrosophila lebanonensis]|uniref:Uncharacterized protein LOC115629599 n=1 Tax=Drosophila lebanonensis TaxID=7225 RepID=A0A6J2U233_DROLE|nr:uncharacterized protein LOC115629599 [Scaptodrosophila lebanonensis]
MDIELSLDEIIERKRGRPSDKKFYLNNNKPRKLLNKQTFKPTKPAVGQTLSLQASPAPARNFDARNKIIQKTRAKITDAREVLIRNMRQSGIDAREVLLERKKERQQHHAESPPPPVREAIGPGGVHKGRFGHRVITMTNKPGGTIQTLWNPEEPLPRVRVGGGVSGGGGGIYKAVVGAMPPHQPYMPRLNKPVQPFAPRGYVDHDNMQDLEEEELSRTLHFSNYKSQPPGPNVRFKFGGGGYDMDDVEMVSVTGPSIANDPFAIYEPIRNRSERSALPPSLATHTDAGEQLFERRQRNLVASANLPESLRARLFGSEPDRRVSHGIYANENGSQPTGISVVAGGGGSTGGGGPLRRSPPPPPLAALNHKPGYRLLVSNLHANVTTADIRELFNDIGPMYDAHVVRPGTAEVIYKSLEHAEKAVDAYHQREFDGQPMHCVLVNPHSSNRSANSASSRTVTTNSSGVEVDIDALHSVLFRDR